VTPPGRSSRSRILAVLLPSRASGLVAVATLAFVRPLGAFLAGVVFFPALALVSARRPMMCRDSCWGAAQNPRARCAAPAEPGPDLGAVVSAAGKVVRVSEQWRIRYHTGADEPVG
jgi:hypothetical protein